MRTDRYSKEFDLLKNMNKVRGPSLLYSGIFVLLTTLILGSSVLATSDAQLQESFDDATRQVNRARGLTLAILKQIKELDATCRSANGSPLFDRKADARNRMARIKPLVDGFHANADDAESLLNNLRSLLDQQSDSSSLVAKLKGEIGTMKNNLQKYQGHVSKYWKRSVDDFGLPPERVHPVPASSSGDATAQIHGELTLGLGASKYKRPNAGTNIDASSSDVSLGLKGRYTPSAATNVDAFFKHQTTTQRREIGLTDFGAAVNHQLSSQVSLVAGFDLFKYSDKELDLVNYSQTGIFAQLAAQTAGHKANVQIRRDSRGYSNISGADYKTFSFTARDMMSFGSGNITMQLRYLKKTNDIEALDHKEINPSVVYHFSPGGSQMGISYQQFKMPNFDDSPTESNRLKLHFYSGRRTATGSKRWGPEIHMYKYPNLDDADMTDFKLTSQSTSRGKKMLLTQWNLVYRMYQDTLQFDFAQAQYRRHSRPVGSGRYTKLNLAARYYIENSVDTATVDNPLLEPYYSTEVFSPPHTLDVYFNIGWQILFTNWLQHLSIGPVLSHRAYIDQNGDDRTNKISDFDFILQNPTNFGGIGFEMRAAGVAGYTVSWRLEIKLLHETHYNAEPMLSKTTLDWRATTSYLIDDRWSTEGFADMHQTRYDVDSPEDLDKLKIGVQVRYLFDVRP